MKEMIERLYDELYSPKVNPEELINNAYLPNYISINFESNQIGLMVTTECIVDNNLEAEYKYQFDNEKRLLTLVSYINRSEEHTSELQSRGHLVCRLLLEKKKKKKITNIQII